MIEECGCPSHHEHGPEGTAGCAICNQEAPERAGSGATGTVTARQPVTHCTCGHHADAHDPWGCVICGGTSKCGTVALGPIEIAATELGAAPAVMTNQTVRELVEEERQRALRALIDSALISSAGPAVSQVELTSALDEIMTRLAGGRAALSDFESSDKAWMCSGCGARYATGEEHTCP